MILTEGNLGHFKGRTDCLFLVLTTWQDHASMRSAPSYQTLVEWLPTETVLIDGLVDFTSPHSAMSAAYVMGMRHPGVVPGSTNYVYLTPDSFWSDGTFARAEHIMEAGKKAIMVLGLRAKLDEMSHVIRQHLCESDGYEAMPTPLIVRHTLANLHQLSEAHNWLSVNFLNVWPSHIYWKVSPELIIAHCFHLHPLVVKAPFNLGAFSSTIDGDFLEAIHYSSDDFHVVTSSDEIFGVELSPNDRTWNQPTGPANLGAVRAFAKWNANSIHWSFFPQRIRISSEPEFNGRLSPALEQNIDHVVASIRGIETTSRFFSLAGLRVLRTLVVRLIRRSSWLLFAIPRKLLRKGHYQ